MSPNRAPVRPIPSSMVAPRPWLPLRSPASTRRRPGSFFYQGRTAPTPGRSGRSADVETEPHRENRVAWSPATKQCLPVGWLTDDDIRHFAVEGYLVVRDVVPQALLAAADAEI